MPAILAITHQLQMAKVADQVLVLQDGTVKDVNLTVVRLRKRKCWDVGGTHRWWW
jgi:ABC-type transport system involved in cytochrome bd biosynthesis fused ATPase/permease subunit